jgi:hypothetical protein
MRRTLIAVSADPGLLAIAGTIVASAVTVAIIRAGDFVASRS